MPVPDRRQRLARPKGRRRRAGSHTKARTVWPRRSALAITSTPMLPAAPTTGTFRAWLELGWGHGCGVRSWGWDVLWACGPFSRHVIATDAAAKIASRHPHQRARRAVREGSQRQRRHASAAVLHRADGCVSRSQLSASSISAPNIARNAQPADLRLRACLSLLGSVCGILRKVMTCAMA